MKEFSIYSVGFICMSLCTSIKDKVEIERRANEEHPTGVSSRWEISKDKFNTGEDNPCSCNDNPKTHKHYLLKC